MSGVDELLEAREDFLWLFDDLDDFAVHEVVVHVVLVDEDGGEVRAGFRQEDDALIVGILEIALDVGHTIDDREDIIAVSDRGAGGIDEHVIAVLDGFAVDVGLVHGISRRLDGEETLFLTQQFA